jgi:aminomethyltransferase
MGLIDGAPVTVCRTGYTGEHGYELVLPMDAAPAVWDRIVAAGARPCGLAARDTLRTEMGYALHGNELTLDITPVQARVGWAVGWKKPEFWGRDVLVAEKANGPHRSLWGLEALDRGIPRAHMSVLRGDTRIGEVTSGTFSPTRKLGIGLALLDASAGVNEGDEIELDVRGRRSRVKVVKPPFVKASVR